MADTLRKRMASGFTFRGIGATDVLAQQMKAMDDKRRGRRMTAGIGSEARSSSAAPLLRAGPPNKLSLIHI